MISKIYLENDCPALLRCLVQFIVSCFPYDLAYVPRFADKDS